LGASRVQQRDWEHPQRADWVSGLAAAVGDAAVPVVLVAHSLGCITVAHWAATASMHELTRVQAALLVAPADVERLHAPSCLQGFAPVPRRVLPFKAMVVASASDPYCGERRARELAAAWGASFVSLGDAGHINADSGHGRWEEGMALLPVWTPVRSASA
jgi:hypothetical protein